MEVFQMKTIKFVVSSSNLAVFTEAFENLIFNMRHPKFGSAELQYSVDGAENPEFPLILKACDNTIRICIKDVGIGSQDNKTLATIKALETAGFKMGCALCNAIRNESDLHITIWND